MAHVGQESRLRAARFLCFVSGTLELENAALSTPSQEELSFPKADQSVESERHEVDTGQVNQHALHDFCISTVPVREPERDTDIEHCQQHRGQSGQPHESIYDQGSKNGRRIYGPVSGIRRLERRDKIADDGGTDDSDRHDCDADGFVVSNKEWLRESAESRGPEQAGHHQKTERLRLRERIFPVVAQVDQKEGEVCQATQGTGNLEKPYAGRSKDVPKFVLQFTIAKGTSTNLAPTEGKTLVRHAFLRRQKEPTHAGYRRLSGKMKRAAC